MQNRSATPASKNNLNNSFTGWQMKLRTWQIAIFVLSLFQFGSSQAANSPTVDDIYQEAKAGHLSQAQSMVEEVIAQHPKSGKAHYVAAEIYAKEGNISSAKSELQTAEQLAPGLPFAKPEAVRELKNILNAPAVVSHPVRAQPQTQVIYQPQPTQSSSFPWGTLLIVIGVVAVIALIIKMLNAQRASQINVSSPAMPMPGQPYPAGANAGRYPPAPMQQAAGYPPGYAPPMQQGMAYPGGVAPAMGVGGIMGSGLMGSLATGAAMGAGFAAGEALVDHLVGGNNSSSGNNSASNDAPTYEAPVYEAPVYEAPVYEAPEQTAYEETQSELIAQDDLGGQDFGLVDNANSSWDDNTTVADNSSGDSSGDSSSNEWT